jgi:hypothetical protein
VYVCDTFILFYSVYITADVKDILILAETFFPAATEKHCVEIQTNSM